MRDAGRSARRKLGVVTAFALLVSAVLSHWPGLGLGPPHDPGPDKIVHMVLYALLATGAWFSGWFRSLWMLWIAGVLWGALDEWTQGWAIIGRHRDWEDWVADLMGVSLAVAWIVATKPLGGWESRRRRAARDAAMAELFSKWWPWPAVLLGALIGAAGSLPLFMFIGERSWAMPSRQVVITGLIVVAIASAHAAVEILLRMTVLPKRPLLPDRVMGRLVAGPAIMALLLLVLLMGVAQLTLILRPILRSAAVVDEWYRMRSPTLRAAIDLGLILFLAAWAARRARRRITARIDRAHLECIRCDHSLAGTEATNGVGRCPECGTDYEVPPGEGAAALAR
ncbi:MAG: VanZ family protein [Phycisphaeraceae bacterium]|nr:VanZ family protein [Phycisphaeraceae bacterium]